MESGEQSPKPMGQPGLLVLLEVNEWFCKHVARCRHQIDSDAPIKEAKTTVMPHLPAAWILPEKGTVNIAVTAETGRQAYFSESSNLPSRVIIIPQHQHSVEDLAEDITEDRALFLASKKSLDCS